MHGKMTVEESLNFSDKKLSIQALIAARFSKQASSANRGGASAATRPRNRSGLATEAPPCSELWYLPPAPTNVKVVLSCQPSQPKQGSTPDQEE
jgi:hypothetical protein